MYPAILFVGGLVNVMIEKADARGSASAFDWIDFYSGILGASFGIAATEGLDRHIRWELFDRYQSPP